MMTPMARIWRRFRRQIVPIPLTSLDAYALWAADYPPQAHNPLMHAEEAAMHALLPDVRGRVALDLAAGTGRYGLLLRDAGARIVIALDNSAPMLAANPLSYRAIASLDAIPLAQESIDLVVCGMAIGHTRDLRSAFAAIAWVLRPGGVALISDFHPIMHFTGAKRTFQTGGTTYAVEHYPHLYADHHAAAGSSGLTIDAVREPTLTPGGAPVVLVLRLVK